MITASSTARPMGLKSASASRLILYVPRSMPIIVAGRFAHCLLILPLNGRLADNDLDGPNQPLLSPDDKRRR